MAINQDGGGVFGVPASPVTVAGIVMVAEDITFQQTGTRADQDDSNGEPVGSVTIPGRIEVSGTFQLPTPTSAVPSVTDSFFVPTTTRFSGTYILTEVGEQHSQANFAKVSFSGYKKIN
jgi:hypothetical protein